MPLACFIAQASGIINSGRTITTFPPLSLDLYSVSCAIGKALFVTITHYHNALYSNRLILACVIYSSYL